MFTFLSLEFLAVFHVDVHVPGLSATVLWVVCLCRHGAPSQVPAPCGYTWPILPVLASCSHMGIFLPLPPTPHLSPIKIRMSP